MDKKFLKIVGLIMIGVIIGSVGTIAKFRLESKSASAQVARCSPGSNDCYLVCERWSDIAQVCSRYGWHTLDEIAGR